MKLPNGERADLGTKLEDYVLNPNHWEGRHKARVFESTLGITVNNQEVLREAILEAAANSDEANAIGDNGHGMVYVLRFPFNDSEQNRNDSNGVDHLARGRLSPLGNLLYIIVDE